MTARRLVLATRNEHKVHELRQILADLVDELEVQLEEALEEAVDEQQVLAAVRERVRGFRALA